MMNSCEGATRPQASGMRSAEAEDDAKTAGPLAGSLVKCNSSTQTCNEGAMLPSEIVEKNLKYVSVRETLMNVNEAFKTNNAPQDYKEISSKRYVEIEMEFLYSQLIMFAKLKFEKGRRDLAIPDETVDASKIHPQPSR
ncbi:hypothetical protein FHW67_003874 [Herbaspirillum sp. Sphag1AN]|uniref:hypothetical protein n=1 Tax=unclassified Herbaspirillum TaxID=2624150 RepID=UPI00162179D2|nr:MULTISPECIES: hypothetical protein [unclassified Herbaspirillum]MBB3214553.1 hypothetical protein [Herbaspirillum sp. Sphag1AN]MBB3247699.1 hypothetical protein [Herbaspirillum sp. Sphag64]